MSVSWWSWTQPVLVFKWMLVLHVRSELGPCVTFNKWLQEKEVFGDSVQKSTFYLLIINSWKKNKSCNKYVDWFLIAFDLLYVYSLVRQLISNFTIIIPYIVNLCKLIKQVKSTFVNLVILMLKLSLFWVM